MYRQPTHIDPWSQWTNVALEFWESWMQSMLARRASQARDSLDAFAIARPDRPVTVTTNQRRSVR